MPILPEALICAGALVFAALLTGVIRRIALSQGVLDVPNERSSHNVATPRGGGLAIVLVTSASLAAFGLYGLGDAALRWALIGGGGLVALVGFLDDRSGVSAGVRLAVHAGAATWAVICLGGLPPLRIGEHLLHLGLAGDALAVAAIVWTLNLFNFMDGIDAIAASEAAFVAGAGGALGLVGGFAPDEAIIALAFAAACVGFLLWNWPPARIFMGDVGSGYLGFVLSVLALAAARKNPVAIWIWLILGGVFFVDATVTLLRRMGRRERLHQAHRSHAYQWLARRWNSHLRVTLAVQGVNLLWLLPLAILAVLHPGAAALLTTCSLAPLATLAIISGSGRRERAP